MFEHHRIKMPTRPHYLILLFILFIIVYIFLVITPNNNIVRKFTPNSFVNPFDDDQPKDSLKSKFLYKNPTINSLLEVEYQKFLSEKLNIFIIEPFLLYRKIERESKSAQEFEEFKWRYNLPQDFRWRANCLTVGIYADKFDDSIIILGKFTEILRVTGRNGPFESSNNSNSVHHIFYRSTNDLTNISLQLHLVVFHRIKNFLWVGPIPQLIQFNLTDNHDHNPNHSFVLHYGQVEQIFDPFKIVPNEDGIQCPRDVKHFVGQLPTSRYIHCPEERVKWLEANNVTIDENKVKASAKAIVDFKRFMNTMRMEFWIACGTLLGWHRQCHVTPYTSDTDFGTWSKYLLGIDQTRTWKAEAEKHDLELYLRFGEPTHSMEFSFWSREEKVDLFFIYQNVSHYLLPVHAPPKYFYSHYPKYELCSVELLGYKLLAPCDPQSIIEIEYGTNWNKPITEWDYIHSPLNAGEMIDFSYNVEQLERF